MRKLLSGVVFVLFVALFVVGWPADVEQNCQQTGSLFECIDCKVEQDGEHGWIVDLGPGSCFTAFCTCPGCDPDIESCGICDKNCPVCYDCGGV